MHSNVTVVYNYVYLFLVFSVGVSTFCVEQSAERLAVIGHVVRNI